MRHATILGAIAALGMSSAALAAQGVDYTFVEGGYTYGEQAGGLMDGNGYRIAASLELPANLIVAASYRHMNYSGLPDMKATSAGLGYKWVLGDSFDIISSISYERNELFGNHETGLGLQLGMRGRVTDKVQLSASLGYVDADFPRHSFAVSAGARRYFSNPALSVALDVYKGTLWGFTNGDETLFTLSVRYDFGKLFH
jgi:hypothetical protein